MDRNDATVRASHLDTLPGGLRQLASLQLRRPWIPVVAAFAIAVVGFLLAARLELKTRFDQLLPDSQPSVVELRRVLGRIAAASKVYVVIEGAPTPELRAFSDQLVPELKAIGSPHIESAENGIFAAKNYLKPRAGLFLSYEELTKLRTDIDARWDWEVAKETGELEEGEVEPPAINAAELKKRFSVSNSTAEQDYPDGYFESADHSAVVILASTSIASGDLNGSTIAFNKVKERVAALKARFPNKSIHVSYAGDMVVGLSEYGAMLDDLINVGVSGVAMVLIVIFLYFMRLRALAVMGLTIVVGIAWSFGLAQLFVGHLNIATGFLFSIIAGNGINFGIMYMARYFEGRRLGDSVDKSVIDAHRTTVASTLTAAVTTCAAYGSLAVTDFRAFRHFALIGAAGMVCCWIATYLVTPPLLVLIERVTPFRVNESHWFGRARARGVPYGEAFAAITKSAPRLLSVIAIATTAAGIAMAVHYLRSDPQEYNMKELQNDIQSSGEMYRAGRVAAPILGAAVNSSMILLADRADQVRDLKKTLAARRDSAPADNKPLGEIRTLFDFVADDQVRKVPVLNAIAKKMRRAREKGFVNEVDWREASQTLPPENLTPYTINDLPAELARPFTERDGTRGRLVLVESTTGKSDDDLHYLLTWSDALRETRLPNGEIVRGSGRPVIFADMLKAVMTDMPKAVALSLGLSLIAVGIMFRRKNAGWVALSLLMGLAWMAFVMNRAHLKLNFFNFLALPITFGIGADYAVNLMQRYVTDGSKNVLASVRTTGGAIVLCSLTTIVGYLALIRSVNRAIRSLGVLAVIGEVTCVVAAIVALPALLLWRERRKG